MRLHASDKELRDMAAALPHWRRSKAIRVTREVRKVWQELAKSQEKPARMCRFCIAYSQAKETWSCHLCPVYSRQKVMPGLCIRVYYYYHDQRVDCFSQRREYTRRCLRIVALCSRMILAFQDKL